MSDLINRLNETTANMSDARITKQMLQALAPLPDTAMRLLSLLDDPDVPLREIASVAARDVGLSATMLRMANSSMFGLRGRVGSISDALRVIGTAQARLLILASGISQSAQKELPQYGLGAGSFMRHSELVANLTMCVAHETRFPNIGLAYSAGLLHDIGKIVLNGLARQQPAAGTFETEMRAKRCSLLDAEATLHGSDHALVGRQLGELWSLPTELCDAIALHHNEGPVDTTNQLAWCVAVANGVAGTADESYPVANRAASVDPGDGVDMAKLAKSAADFLSEAA